MQASDIHPTGQSVAEIQAIVNDIIRVSHIPGALERLSDQHKAVLATALRESHQYMGTARVHALFPDTGPLRRELYPKHIEHFWAGHDYKARAFMAANRIGKSWAGAYELTCHAIGWYPHWWTGWRIDRPGEYVIAAKRTKTIRRTPQKALFGDAERGAKGKFRLKGGAMVPNANILHDSTIFMTAAPGTLSEINVRYKDSELEYSKMFFLSYEMGRGPFEGFEVDAAWLDEECPIDIFAETAKRTMTTSGRLILTWTPLDGLTEVVMKFIDKDFRPPQVTDIDVDMLVPPTLPRELFH